MSVSGVAPMSSDEIHGEDKVPNELSCVKRVLIPPERKGMIKLNKALFDKEILVPTVTIPEERLKCFLPRLKPFLLKVKKLTNVLPLEGNRQKKILLDPEKVTNLNVFIDSLVELQNEEEIKKSVSYEIIKITYDNWSLNQLVDSILPDDNEKFSGFSATGHVVHVNLRNHLLPYKQIIGEILLDKVPNARTVVNKLEQIESKYRNFQMELIAGEPNTVVKLKENRCDFEFDFATVYWNSRLSTEHEKVVNFLGKNSVVFDVFAGVGPFTIPAAKKKCHVLANDLNPESTKWLQQNVQKNKVSNFVKVYNKDGRDFIREDVSKYLKEQLAKDDEEHLQAGYHVIMNLPAIAVEFLDAFWNLLDYSEDLSSRNATGENMCILPQQFKLTIHVYCFIKDIDNYQEKALQLVKDKLQYDLTKEQIIEIASVRTVAPNKEMLRVSFALPLDVLKGNVSASSSQKRKHSDADLY